MNFLLLYVYVACIYIPQHQTSNHTQCLIFFKITVNLISYWNKRPLKNQTVFHANYCKNQNSILVASEIVISGYIHDSYTLHIMTQNKGLYFLLEIHSFNVFVLLIYKELCVCVQARACVSSLQPKLSQQKGQNFLRSNNITKKVRRVMNLITDK